MYSNVGRDHEPLLIKLLTNLFHKPLASGSSFLCYSWYFQFGFFKDILSLIEMRTLRCFSPHVFIYICFNLSRHAVVSALLKDVCVLPLCLENVWRSRNELALRSVVTVGSIMMMVMIMMKVMTFRSVSKMLNQWSNQNVIKNISDVHPFINHN